MNPLIKSSSGCIKRDLGIHQAYRKGCLIVYVSVDDICDAESILRLGFSVTSFLVINSGENVIIINDQLRSHYNSN